MKNIFKFSAIALLVAGFFTSCAKELSAPVQAPVNGKTHTFTLAFAENNTKVAVTEAGKTTWEVGDEILIHGAGETNKTIVTLKAEDILADGKKAQITFSGIEPYDRSSDRGYTSVYYAQYPASASKQSGDFFYYADFVETNDFLMAAYNVDSTFVFYNLTGVITFKADGNFNSYKFKGNNGETVGYTQLRSRLANKADAPVLEYKYSASGDLTEIEGTAVPGELNHICLPLGTDFTGGFTITLCKNGRELYTATTQTAVKVDRNQILSVGDITDKLVELPAPETNDHTSAIALERAVDLSAEGSANSYIITAPGVYKLPAVKGNSTEKLPMLFDAEILWESYSNAEEVEANSVIAAIDYEGEWVVFKTPDALKPGNALIAAEDFKGNVLWSWHIWIPATPIETNTYGISTHKLMDRNLGALVAADTTSKITGEMLGLAYQWGRKDPFVSVGSIDATTPAKVAGIARTKNAESNDPGVAMTVAETIANPTVFVNRKGDWNAEPDNNLWAEEKTIYDPCPPGYKVPASSEVDIFASDATIDNIKGWAYDATKSHTFAVGEPATVFPIGGYLNYSGSYDKPGERVKIYHAPSVSQYAPAVYVYAGPTFKPQEGQRRAVAGNVRCVTIEGEAVQNLKFGLREGEEANLTAAFDSTGAAIWHIDADKEVEFEAVVKLNGEVTTAGVTVEKYEAGGGHVAINFAANDSPAAKEWTVTVTTTTEGVANKEIALKFVQGPYEYSDLAVLNAAIIADGTKTVDRIITIAPTAKLYVTKKSGKSVFLQSAHSAFTGGILLYLDSNDPILGKLYECITIYGKVTATTTSYFGVPEITKLTFAETDVTLGKDESLWPCEKVTIADMEANYMKYVNVKTELNNNYNGVTVTDGFDSSDRNGKIKDSTGEIDLYVKVTDGSIKGHVTGTKLNKIIVWPTFNNEKHQIGLWSMPNDVKSIPSVFTVPETKNVAVGSTVDLAAKVNSGATITYASSDEAVATVSAEGVVTGVAVGTATITLSAADTTWVKANGSSYNWKFLAGQATCAVTVTAEEVPEPVDPFSIDLTYAKGENSYEEKATINGTADVKVLKIGKTSAAGSIKVTIPAGTTKVTYYAVGWKNSTTTLDFQIGGASALTQAIAPNDGATSTSPYTLTVTDSDKYEINVPFQQETEVTVTTTASARAILWGFKAE